MFDLAREQAVAHGRNFDFSATEAPDARRLGVLPDRPNSECIRTWHSGLPLTFVGGRPIECRASVSKKIQLALKRAIDIFGGALILLALAPSLLLVALAIRLSSPGPALFRQLREGHNGAPISVYKFRTMYIERCDASGIAQTKNADPRITPIGRLLRRTSIDELPQLLNVLNGDMSLVGPRPHAFGTLAAGIQYDLAVHYYAARQAMKPGISGWAQANGFRGPTEDADKARARIDHDLAYIENFSLLLDFRVISRTLAREFLNGSGL